MVFLLSLGIALSVLFSLEVALACVAVNGLPRGDDSSICSHFERGWQSWILVGPLALVSLIEVPLDRQIFKRGVREVSMLDSELPR